VELARRCADVDGVARLDDLEWRDGRIAVTVTTELMYGPEKKPLLLVRRGDRYILDPSIYRGLLPASEVFDVTDEITSFRAELGVRDRETAVEWPCPAEFTAQIEELGRAEGVDGVACRVVMRGLGYLDPRKTRARGPLAKGMWDVWVRVNGVGFAKRARLGADRAPHVDARCLPALLGEPARLTVPYFTNPGGNITLDVNRRSKKLGPAVTDSDIRRVPTGRRWLEFELPIATRPGTAPTEALLVVRGDSAATTHSLPAVLLPIGDRMHLRARSRLDGGAKPHTGTFDLVGWLDGASTPEVMIGKVKVPANGRLSVSEMPVVDPAVARKARTTHRRAETQRIARRFGGPLLRRLSPGPRHAIRARARSWGL